MSRGHPFSVPEAATRLASTLDRAHEDDPTIGAAVAAILRPETTGAEVLLIRRADREGDPWSGHMAFPGGRRAPPDPDLVATATRETLEEVGLDLRTHARLIGRLPDLPAFARARRTGLVIAPFVFALEREAVLTFDPREVAEALWAPLLPMATGEVASTMRYERDGVAVDLPSWNVQGHVVWGLTYRMLETLFALILPPLPIL